MHQVYSDALDCTWALRNACSPANAWLLCKHYSLLSLPPSKSFGGRGWEGEQLRRLHTKAVPSWCSLCCPSRPVHPWDQRGQRVACSGTSRAASSQAGAHLGGTHRGGGGGGGWHSLSRCESSCTSTLSASSARPVRPPSGNRHTHTHPPLVTTGPARGHTAHTAPHPAPQNNAPCRCCRFHGGRAPL